MTLDALRITQSGLCCSVGFNLAAASCAMRAGMDHFQETRFRDFNGKPLRAALLPLGDLWGEARLAALAEAAVRDCLRQDTTDDSAPLGVILLAAETDRPHTEPERYAVCVQAIDKALDHRPVVQRATLTAGRAGIGPALATAWQWLEAGSVGSVLLVGADSYLDAATINYLLGQRRLLASDNAAGFIPGEAAAAILLARPSQDDDARQVLISGIGQAQEEAKPDGEVPNRASGLTQAVRVALAQAGLSAAELDFRLADHNGDPFLSAESALAFVRIMAGSQVQPVALHPAEHVGEVGAAAGVVGLAYATSLLARDQAPGTVGIVHMSNDDGLRAAAVIELVGDHA